MKQDHLGNKLYVRTVNKFNSVSLPAEVAEYLRAKEEMISAADKQSDRDDLCIFFAPNNRGFLINHFSSHASLTLAVGWAEKIKKLGSPTKELRADNYVCTRCDDAELKNDSIKLPDVYVKYAGIADYKKGEKREVVVRQLQKGHPLEVGFVQIMDKETWNRRFPDYTV